jgi:hypothetical protein
MASAAKSTVPSIAAQVRDRILRRTNRASGMIRHQNDSGRRCCKPVRTRKCLPNADAAIVVTFAQPGIPRSRRKAPTMQADIGVTIHAPAQPRLTCFSGQRHVVSGARVWRLGIGARRRIREFSDRR